MKGIIDRIKGFLRRNYSVSALALLPLVVAGCESIDDDRIYSMNVNLSVAPQPVWETYGVSGFGTYRYFVPRLREPAGFSYFEQTAVGFGGVLLVSGSNIFSGDAGVPLAYDLACPVERSAKVLVRMEPGDTFPVARCPECGSVYNVVEGGGAPVDGPARDHHYGLRRYECAPAAGGGYHIYNPSY